MKWIMTLLFVALAPGVFGEDGDEPYFLDGSCEQDSTGRIWGLPRTENTPGRLAYWKDGAWESSAIPRISNGAEPVNPSGIQRLHTGEVMVSWYLNQTNQLAYTCHRGEDVRVAAIIPITENGVDSALVDSEGTVWAMQRRGLYRIPPDPVQAEFPKKAVTHFSMLQYHESPYPVEIAEANYRPPSLFMDASNRVWAWVPALPPYGWEPGMRGCFIVEGGIPVHHPAFEGIPDAPFSVLTPKSGNVYWLAAVGHGLYEFDTGSLRGTPVPEPEPGAFRNIFQVTAVKGDWYVLASPETVMEDWAAQVTSLWRLRDGTWQRVLAGLEQTPYSVAETVDGLWAGSGNGGLWFVPRNGDKPVRLDWRRGFDMSSVHQLYALSGESVLAVVSRARWTWKHEARELRYKDFAVAPRAVTNVKQERFICLPEPDETGMLWAVRLETPRVLSAWGGSAWTEHPLPSDATPLALASVNPDDKGRIWVWQWKEYKGFRYDLAAGPVFILDTKTKEWTNHESFFKAVVDERARVGEFRFRSANAIQPTFGPENQAAFNFSSHRRLHYLDGGSWHVYERDFTRKYVNLDTHIQQMHFDDKGRLCVSVYAHDYQAGQDQQFVLVRNADDSWTRVDGAMPEPSPSPGEALRKRPDYPMNRDGNIRYAVNVDARDMLWYWYMKDGQLFRGGLGAEAAQFYSGEASPFGGEENLWRVDIDRAGNAWFALSNGHDACVLMPRDPAVDTKASVSTEAVDSVRVTMSAPGVREPRFVWRLDGGAWSIPQKDAEVRLATLSGGEHTFEVFALDAYLTPDATSAVVAFSIDIDTGQQIAGWVEQLSSPDYDARNNAVKALQQRPEESLKALRDAREKASDDAKWWIDVAIQNIERTQKKP